MEAIASAASISQLVVYSLSSVHYLRKLSSELSQGKSVYYEEERNIRSLLDIVSRLSVQNDIGDCDPLLTILVDISRLACDILHCFRPKIVWGINLTPIINKDKIVSLLAVLDNKRQLLHLHITQVNSNVLSSLQSGDKGPRRDSTMVQQDCELDLDGGDVQGISEILGGTHVGDLDRFTRVRVRHGKVGEGAMSLTLNPTELSNADRMQAHVRNVDLAKQRHKAKVMGSPTRRKTNNGITEGALIPGIVQGGVETASSLSWSARASDAGFASSISSLSHVEFDASLDAMLETCNPSDVVLNPLPKNDLEVRFNKLRKTGHGSERDAEPAVHSE
ncbi:hypothetical protein T440DRAFT_468230 [Plenodomus tracheiphilus IPT5]|uniref:Uncharacterized protein n=1 Tax=Plenodomus tracheiphilus IPT5 TaxID=1408161 RepID=A0A6A7B8E1_9PLEO|nr:hypothetical protein T440DRAFT_468230 [Plenodomus tracheiphilus IPT5]